MNAVRAALMVLGVALGGVGVIELLSEDLEDLLAAVLWLGGGVLLHDLVLAPLVVGLAVGGAALLPWWVRSPAAAVVVVLGSVTLMAVPVLGRFGARADNPTLLDRPYLAGWLVFAGLVLGWAGAWAVAQRRGGGG